MKIPCKDGNEMDMASSRYRRRCHNPHFSYKQIKRGYRRRVRRTKVAHISEFD